MARRELTEEELQLAQSTIANKWEDNPPQEPENPDVARIKRQLEITDMQLQITKLKADLSELEEQLAYFTDPHSAYDSSKGCPACEWKDGVITKLCWTHEAYQQAEKRETVLVGEVERLKKRLMEVALENPDAKRTY